MGSARGPKHKQHNERELKCTSQGGGGSLLVIPSHSETRHQPGPARRAPVARERRISTVGKRLCWLGGC
jgi:hypothetical protein